MIDKRTKRTQEAAPVDNHEAFKKRLTSASHDLKKRQENLSRYICVLEFLLEQNREALWNWSQQHKYAHDIQQAYTGGAEGYQIIGDLVTTASRMKSLFGKRVNVLNEKHMAVEANSDVVAKAIADLDASYTKLGLSKMLQDGKAKLLATESALNGSISPVEANSPVMSQELHAAREAVAMAEALLELKGH